MKYITKKNIIVTLIFSAIFLGASCLKKQNLLEEAFSAPVPPEQIASALGEGFGYINYNDIKVNDKTSIVLSQTIQDGATQILEQQDVTIESVNNNNTTLELKVLAKIFNPLESTDVAPVEWNPVFAKYSGYAFATDSSASGPTYLFQVLQNLALGSCYDDGSYPETCHNLSVTSVDYKVPVSSAYQHSCADIYNCYIKAKKIEFDLIRKYEFESDGKPRRLHYTLVLSPSVPFTARVLRYCTRALYDVSGVSQKILADLCYNVNGYTFGQ